MAVTKISWLLPPSKLKLAINDVHVWRVRLNQKRLETDYTTPWIGLMFPWRRENPPGCCALKEAQSKRLVGL
jgi:hypothetical protein